MPQQTPRRRLGYPVSTPPVSTPPNNPPRSPRPGATYANGEETSLISFKHQLAYFQRLLGSVYTPASTGTPIPSAESAGHIVTAVREAKPKTVKFAAPSPSVSSEEDSEDDPRIVTGSIYSPPSSPQEPPQPPPKSPLRQKQERPTQGQLPAPTPPPKHALPEIPPTTPLRLSAYGVSGSQAASPARANTPMRAEASSNSSSAQHQPGVGLGDQTFGSDPRSPSVTSGSGTTPSRGRPTVNIRDCRVHGETYAHGCEWCHTDPIVRVVEIPRWDEYVPAWRRMNRPRQA
ncbi:hypothetical protein GCG54_00009407 [Colletotrichum gloeosporioides]|uniref:Uncharacterized protein n=1 Tax=Colletotrichum gloeosporioides TaxID=474922 RepID=A0A8H4FDX1_COLGL|nr:uncharacterized protein GCG54_00009407 [Colletotrichum gloeosporioides]KAF3797434.1 hypothetical protein GCG54_00009407 [Colletotrichum gloeosporioides]